MIAKWQTRLKQELKFRSAFESLAEHEWKELLDTKTVLSANHDTVLSIDWPHYCLGASEGCGGPGGWCYTMTGHQASEGHDRKVAMIDQAARCVPRILADKIVMEVTVAVNNGALRYPNLRYSGSGELQECHVPVLKLVGEEGIHLWGFTRLPKVATMLRSIGASVLVSCDRTTSMSTIEAVRDLGFGFAYTSCSVTDVPPAGTVVTFPVHKAGSVREVIDDESVCPKVIDEYFHGARTKAWCQARCNRCHGGR